MFAIGNKSGHLSNARSSVFEIMCGIAHRLSVVLACVANLRQYKMLRMSGYILDRDLFIGGFSRRSTMDQSRCVLVFPLLVEAVLHTATTSMWCIETHVALPATPPCS